jgi:hypothetical protein
MSNKYEVFGGALGLVREEGLIVLRKVRPLIIEKIITKF